MSRYRNSASVSRVPWDDGSRARAKHERPSVIMSSPYRRALQTTEHVARELAVEDVACVIDERLREKEFGELNRFTKSGILARFPEEARRRADLGKFYYRPPGGRELV